MSGHLFEFEWEWKGGGCLLEAGHLLTFSALRMGTYSNKYSSKESSCLFLRKNKRLLAFSARSDAAARFMSASYCPLESLSFKLGIFFKYSFYW